MRKYFVQYSADFANTYNVCYTDNTKDEEKAIEIGMERITRKDAERLCMRESARRKDDPNFSGYASTVITPFGYDDDWRNDRNMEKIGRFIERKRP